MPLAIFLATFIFTFRSGGDATHRWMVRLQPFIAAPLVIGLFGGERAYWMVGWTDAFSNILAAIWRLKVGQ